MQQITKWEADDGREFSDMDECIEYENLCDQVERIISAFPKKPENDGCSFANGGGYIQLSEEVVKTTRNKLLDLIATKITHNWVEESRFMNVHPSYVGRLVDECNIRPFIQAWSRISCIDKQWREWGQPYYAANPHEGEQIMLASV